MKITSHAKINLTLDVVSKPKNKKGYHHIRTIFQQIELHDLITLKKEQSHKIILTCNNPKVPRGAKNTIIKALTLLKKEAQQNKKAKDLCGLQIHLQKNIPIASGLGGGSSNAAAALQAANQIWQLHFSRQKLSQIASKVGMDAPFFLRGGTALGTHYGEKIRPLTPLSQKFLLIINDAAKRSTQHMYQALREYTTNQNYQKTKQLITSIQKGKKSNIAQFFHNDFEQIPNKKFATLKKKLVEFGASYVGMSGSGPTLFAIFQSSKNREKAYQFLKGRVKFCALSSYHSHLPDKI